jgi:hypothetical protein
MFVDELIEAKETKRLKALLSDIPSAKFQLSDGQLLMPIAKYFATKMRSVIRSLKNGAHLFEALDVAGISHCWLPVHVWPTLERLDRYEKPGRELAKILEAELR